MKRLFLILVLVSCLLVSCKKDSGVGCFNTTGNIKTELRSIAGFNTILLRDNVNLILKKSNANSVVVEAGSNLINGIVTDVNNNGVLEIRNDNNCNWIRSFDNPVNVYLNYVDIDSIQYRSIGNITTDNVLQTDSLWIMAHEGAGVINLNIDVRTLYCALHYGTLDIILSGKSGLSYVYSASFGLINMLSLKSNFVYIDSRSSNDTYVWADIHLGATIENIGNIYYQGNPESVSFDKLGPGELIRLPD